MDKNFDLMTPLLGSQSFQVKNRSKNLNELSNEKFFVLNLHSNSSSTEDKDRAYKGRLQFIDFAKQKNMRKEKYKVAEQAHSIPTRYMYVKERTLSAFTDDFRSKYPSKIPAEYYHLTHWYGENFEDEEDDYIDKTFLSPRRIDRINKRIDEFGSITKNFDESCKEKLRLKLKAEVLKSHIPKLSTMQTFFTLTKGFVGIAMLLFPNGYYNAGWLFGTCSIIVIGSLIMLSMNLLLSVSERVPGSFSSLGEKSLGKAGKIFCDIALSLTQIGFVCVHIVFISQNLNSILLSTYNFTINKWLIGVACFCVYTPLTWVRRIEHFAKYHIFADITVITALIIIAVFAALSFEPHETVPINDNHYMVFVGTCVFAFEGVGIVLPVKDTCKDPSKYRKILTIMISIVTCILISFGLFNYLAYPTEELQNAKLITRLLPHDSRVVQI